MCSTFSPKHGDNVTISKPCGEFFVKDSDAEMVYMGGGFGMAFLFPIRNNLDT